MKRNIFCSSLGALISVVTLFCSCNQYAVMATDSELAESGEKTDREPNCRLFSRDRRCNANYLLGQCDNDRDALEERLGELETELSDMQNELIRCNSLIAPSSGTAIQRDMYVGVGGMAVGILGLWTYQKLLGNKKTQKVVPVPELLESSSGNVVASPISESTVRDRNSVQNSGIEERLSILEKDVKENKREVKGARKDATEALKTSNETLATFTEVTSVIASIAKSVNLEDMDPELVSKMSMLKDKGSKSTEDKPVED